MVLAHFQHTPEFSEPPTIAQIERQIRWEAAAVEAGIRRYHEELNKPGTTIADTSPGQRIIGEIMQGVCSLALRRARAAQGGGRERPRPDAGLDALDVVAPTGEARLPHPSLGDDPATRGNTSWSPTAASRRPPWP